MTILLCIVGYFAVAIPLGCWIGGRLKAAAPDAMDEIYGDWPYMWPRGRQD